ncbi:hypothetical protein C5167_040090 [Papaver somniferum]|uniref:Bifunctional inhibitor/plant lipid transfer protein/seed storage helical domain-containing protein n=1 Tax=Papaver somniferum TaxID=3469 RepID=A0A4Y7IHE0_PAPSO|nr:hypothetical protein C5167_040090 [Papaver somniferum]
MAKPVSLLSLGFCLVLVMSMTSEGVNAVKCDIQDVRISGCKSACEKLFADTCKSTCERLYVGVVTSKVLLERSKLALDTFYIPKCQCCHD